MSKGASTGGAAGNDAGGAGRAGDGSGGGADAGACEKVTDPSIPDLSSGRPWLPALCALTAAQRALLEKYDQVFRSKRVMPDGSGANDARIELAEQRMRNFWHIARDASGNVSGDPVETAAQQGGVPFYSPNTQETLTDTLSILGTEYRKATPEQLARIEPLYLDLLQHMLNEYARKKSYPPIVKAWFMVGPIKPRTRFSQ